MYKIYFYDDINRLNPTRFHKVTGELLTVKTHNGPWRNNYITIFDIYIGTSVSSSKEYIYTFNELLHISHTVDNLYIYRYKINEHDKSFISHVYAGDILWLYPRQFKTSSKRIG